MAANHDVSARPELETGAAEPRAGGRLPWLRAAVAQDRAALLAALVLSAAGLPLALADTPLWWLGGSILLGAASLLARVYGPRVRGRLAELGAPRTLRGLRVRPLAALVEGACVASVVCLSLAMLWDLAGGDRPIGGEHPVHYARAHQLGERLASSGRIAGYSHDWFTGYPASYVDAPGPDLLVQAVHALGLGALGLGSAYALTVLLVHVLGGLSVYGLGRLLAGPACGWIAAVLCSTDLSAVGLGGFAGAIEQGAWPQALSLSLCVVALCSVPAIAAGPGLRPLGAFGLSLGVAILMHPVALFALGPLLVCAALAAALADGVRAPAALLRLLLGCALALLVATPFLIPWASARGDTRSAGAYWETTYELARGVLELRAFPGTLGWVLALGLPALCLLLRTRRFVSLLVALLALCIPLVASSTFVDELHLPALARGLPRAEVAPLAALAKPLWFVLAAYFAVAVLTRARTLFLGEPVQGAKDSPARAALFAAVLGLLTLPVLVPAAQAFVTRHVRKTVVTQANHPLRAQRERLVRWLQRELPRDGFYRIAVLGEAGAELLDLGAAVDRPIFAAADAVPSRFVYRAGGDDPALLEAANVRYAVARERVRAGWFDQVAAFGPYRVYRFERYRPRPFTIDGGAGDVRVERFGAEEIVLRAAPGAHGKLRLHVSYAARFRAYRDGRRVPMTLTYLRSEPRTTGFMTVALAPGVYRFAFERTFGDRLAYPLGLLGIALCGVLVYAGPHPRRAAGLRRALQAVYARLDRLSQPAWARRRALLAAVLGGALLCAGVALSLLRPSIRARELGAAVARVRYDFLEELADASANLEYRETNQPCLGQGERLVCRDEAGNLVPEHYIASSPAVLSGGRLMRCIRARPDHTALLSIRFPDVPPGEAIVGYYGIEPSGRLPNVHRAVELQIMVGGELVYRGSTQSDEGLHWFNAPIARGRGARVPVVFSLRTDSNVRRHFCFAAQMVDLRR